MSEKHRRKQHLFRFICLYIALIIPHTVNGDGEEDRSRRATIETIHPDSAPPSRLKAEESASFGKLFQGVFAKAGSAQVARGILVSFPGAEQEIADEKPEEGDWIAVLHIPLPLQTNETAANGLECLLVFDRVKKAMLFGASAIIILTMNPNILQELDMAQLFSRPVVIIEDAGNVTVLLRMIRSGIKIRVKITYGPSLYDTQTFTIWSACWRARPGSGVVCMSDSRLSKVNPSLFWSYFYSALAVIMLLLLIKTNNQQNNGTDDEIEEELIGSVAWQALSSMKIKRYRKVFCKYDDSERDTCAICLDQFYRRQKIRILPCVHEFHTKCIDPWLIRRPICPLCKLNVLEARNFGGFLHDAGSLVPSY